MIAKYIDNKGKEIKAGLNLDDSIFAAKVNESLLTQYVYSYLSNQRQANAQTKDRGEVRGGGKKPWKQKGSGRARAGSSRSPIWKGGGVTFGPSNERNYKKTMTKKMLKETFRSAFSFLAKENRVTVMQSFEVEKPSVKVILDLFADYLNAKKVTIIQKDSDQNLLKSVSNLSAFNVVNANELNPYLLLNGGHLIIIDSAVELISKNWAGKTVKEVSKNVAHEKSEKNPKVENVVVKTKKTTSSKTK